MEFVLCSVYGAIHDHIRPRRRHADDMRRKYRLTFRGSCALGFVWVKDIDPVSLLAAHAGVPDSIRGLDVLNHHLVWYRLNILTQYPLRPLQDLSHTARTMDGYLYKSDETLLPDTPNIDAQVYTVTGYPCLSSSKHMESLYAEGDLDLIYSGCAFSCRLHVRSWATAPSPSMPTTS